MANEVLIMTAEIVISHASMTELTPKELVREIKEVYGVLASLEAEVVAPQPSRAPVTRARKTRRKKLVESPEAKAVPDEEKAVFMDEDYQEFMESREG